MECRTLGPQHARVIPKETNMLAAPIAPAFRVRAILLHLGSARPTPPTPQVRDCVPAPANLAFAPGIRARRMMRAARQGDC